MVAAGWMILGLLTQAPEPTEPDRAASAAERAAVAAEKAAAAAERSAAALEAIAKKELEPAPAATAAASTPTTPWSGSVGISLISLTGNAATLTFSGLGNVTGRWNAWAVGLKAFGTYGQSRPPEEAASQVTALAAGAQLRGDRSLSSSILTFVAVGAETNHVKSVELLALGEAGVGLIWLDRKEGSFQRSFLRTDLGVRYAREYQFQYYPFALDLPERDVLGPRVGAAFRYALSEGVAFTEDVEAVLALIGATRVLVTSTTKVSSKLTDSTSLAVGFLINHDSIPAPGKVPTDTALTVGIDVGL